MTVAQQIKNFGIQLKCAFTLLLSNDPLRLAGATAFFTTFALPPILLLLIQLFSIIFNRRAISHQLLSELGDVVGREAVMQIIGVLRGFRDLASNWPIAVGGFFFLLLVATTLFKVIQSSLDQVWMIRKSGKKKFKMALLARAKSALLIVFTGILFLATIMTESLKAIFGNYMKDIFPAVAFYLDGTISTLISIVVVWTWFTILFRYLPDGRPGWRVALAGGLLTSLLFNAGTVLLKWMLPNTNIGALYGTSASIVLLLLFVFYSSLIFYYGAAFTKVWGDHTGQPIRPVNNASRYSYEELKQETSTEDK